jgi:hypothetical protein
MQRNETAPAAAQTQDSAAPSKGTETPVPACACPAHGSWYAAADIDRLVRTLDVALNGRDAAERPLLCDVVAQVVDRRWRLVPVDARHLDLLEGMNGDELAAYDYGGRSMMAALRAILDGQDRGTGVANEPWQSLRARLLALCLDAARYRALRQWHANPVGGKHATIVIWGTEPWEPSAAELDAAIDRCRNSSGARR